MADAERDHPYDALYLWAEEQGPETSEMVVSLLLLNSMTADDDLVRRSIFLVERTLLS